MLKGHENELENKLNNLTLKNEIVEKRLNNLLDELDSSEAKVARLTKLKQ